MKKPKSKAPSRKSAFLAAFSITGRVAQAAVAAKVTRDAHYQWMERDPAYPALFAIAKAKAIQGWEDEAVLRATEGVYEPTTYQGQFVFPVTGYRKDKKGQPDLERPIFSKTPFGIWKKSDRLLEFLLKGAKPEVYRDRVEHSGKVQEEWKFSGSMEELIATYRELTAAKPDES